MISFLLPPGMMLSVTKVETRPSVKKAFYGKTADGRTVEQFTLTNSKGAEAKIITFGGRLSSLKVPDRNGRRGSIVLGYNSLAEYENDKFYLGALIGRYANRIAGGRFSLNGITYNLAKNNGRNNLHGGPHGYHKVLWRGSGTVDKNGANVHLHFVSKDGEEGFPGTLEIEVIYTLTEQNELKISYSAVTDKDTIVNLTQHSYFNLAGHGDVLSHRLQLNATRFTPLNKEAIPTGELKTVQGTPLDFTSSTPIGRRINEPDEQLLLGRGYDHNWVLNKNGNALSLAARLFEPGSGRRLVVWTTEPGLQFYTGNFLQSPLIHRGGVCLEAQNFPDAPNQPAFPSPILKGGKIYRQTTVYKFSVN
jgi:aldose 1-epimerase